MRRMILAGLLATWVCGAPAFAADFEAGLLAARVGDFLLAAKEWKPLADAGDVRAMVHLGDLHDLGQGIAMDNSEAARLFRAAAEAGYPPGQLRYALSLQIGRGVTRDKGAALEWLHKAAEQHHAEAIYEVGYAFYAGEGVAADKRQAMKWFLIADEYGWDAAYSAGRFTAAQLTEGEVLDAVFDAGTWMTEHPRPAP